MRKFSAIETIVSCLLILSCIASATGQGMVYASQRKNYSNYGKTYPGQRRYYPGPRKLNFRIIEIGVAPALTSIQDNDPLLLPYAKPSIAASLGLVYGLGVSRRWSFVVQTMYELIRARSTQHFPDLETVPINYYSAASYVTFSPSLRRYFGESGVFLEGGPFISFLLLGRKMADNGMITSPYATTNAGVSAAIGLTPWRKAPSGLNLKLVNNIGLQDIDHHTGTKEWTQSTALVLGMRFRMR